MIVVEDENRGPSEHHGRLQYHPALAQAVRDALQGRVMTSPAPWAWRSTPSRKVRRNALRHSGAVDLREGSQPANPLMLKK